MWLVLLAVSALVPVPAQIRELRGFDFQNGEVFAWGEGAYRWENTTGKPKRIAEGTFSAGGCLMDVDGDGKLDLVVNETLPELALVWYHAPDWKRLVISRGVDSLDMAAVQLLGHRGVLLIHKRMQVRFFDAPKSLDGEWLETELYSFYTPSHEGGLAVADIDGDGRSDVLVGNYWMQSPESWDLPWHLFAIDVWTERAESAQLSLLWTGSGRVASQRAASPARVAWFEPPADRKQLWPTRMLGEDLGLEGATLAALPDGRFVVAERAGRGRIFVFARDFSFVLAHQGMPALGVRALGGKRLLWIGKEGIRILNIQ